MENLSNTKVWLYLGGVAFIVWGIYKLYQVTMLHNYIGFWAVIWLSSIFNLILLHFVGGFKITRK